jgi:hypothetical protein
MRISYQNMILFNCSNVLSTFLQHIPIHFYDCFYVIKVCNKKVGVVWYQAVTKLKPSMKLSQLESCEAA